MTTRQHFSTVKLVLKTRSWHTFSQRNLWTAPNTPSGLDWCWFALYVCFTWVHIFKKWTKSEHRLIEFRKKVWFLMLFHDVSHTIHIIKHSFKDFIMLPEMDFGWYLHTDMVENRSEAPWPLQKVVDPALQPPITGITPWPPVIVERLPQQRHSWTGKPVGPIFVG